MGIAAHTLPIQPVNMIIFGSFARREADAQSDIDAVFVASSDLHDDDEACIESVESWRNSVRAITSNSVEIIEVARADISEKLSSGAHLWLDVARDGIVIQGESLDELREISHAQAS